MNQELKIEWLAALRSGEFEQGRHRLRTNDTYCCLGVLCELTARKGLSPAAVLEFDNGGGIYEYDECIGMPSTAHDQLTGLEGEDQEKLASMNDDGASFDTIADWIEENL